MEETKPKYNEYVAGKKIDRKIIKRVFFATPTYVIFRYRWKKYFTYHHEEVLGKNIVAISEKYSLLDNHITSSEKRKHLSSIVRAHSQAFEGNIDEACKTLDKIKEIIDKKRISNGKVLYLFIYLLSFPINFLISYILFNNATYLKGIFPIDLPQVYLIATMGSIGGFFSFNSYVQKIKVSPDHSIYYHVFFVMYRITISMFASIALYCAIKANIIIGFIDSIGADLYLIYFLSMAAGYSEKLVPNLFVTTNKKMKIIGKDEPNDENEI